MHLIFDFDGTLVDSYQCVVNKFILLADEFNFRKLQTHELEGLRDLSSKEIIKHLKIPLYKIPKIIKRVRIYLHEEIKTLEPIPTLPSVLEKLYEHGCALGILTSNSRENVLAWLEHYQMLHFFKFIRIDSNYFSKKYLLKRLLKRYRIEKSQAFYIGDETRDVEAANKNGIHSIAVTWGYNSEKALFKANPDFIARQPQDILTACGLVTAQVPP